MTLREANNALKSQLSEIEDGDIEAGYILESATGFNRTQMLFNFESLISDILFDIIIHVLSFTNSLIFSSNNFSVLLSKAEKVSSNITILLLLNKKISRYPNRVARVFYIT